MAKRSGKKDSASDLKPSDLGPGVRILVLAGKETFLRDAHTAALRQAVTEATGDEPQVFKFDGLSDEPADVYDECRSYSLMGGYKVVIVDNADKLVVTERRPLAERYATSPADNATLVLRTEKWNRGKKLDDAIRAVGGFIQCDEVAPGKAAGWVQKRAGKLGASMSDDAARQLVDHVGTNLLQLASEVDKLIAAAGAGGTIGAEDVRSLVGRSREEEVWTIQERLLQGDSEAALGYLNDLMRVGTGAPTVLVRWAYSDLARKLHTVARGVAEGKSAKQAAGPLRLWGPSAAWIERIGGRMDEKTAAALFRESVEADFRAKTSRGDEMIGLEALSVRFCEASQAAGSAR